MSSFNPNQTPEQLAPIHSGSKSTKIDSLQAMRAIAAILVMLFHGTKILFREFNYTYCFGIFKVGFMGVDVFFVLSGFIIFYTSKYNTFKLKIFLAKRFIRVFPIYWLVTIILIAMYLISPSPDQAYKSNLEVILASFSLFPQSVYVVGVAWTLTYECLFYLVFGLAFSAGKRGLYITFMVWSGLIVICYLLKFQFQNFAVNSLINPIILTFTFGCLIGHIFRKYKSIKYSNAILLGGILYLAISYSLFYYQVTYVNPNAFTTPISRVYLFGIPSALIVLGLLYSKWRAPQFLVKIGDASYSLYLIHGTVLSMLIKIILKLHLNNFFNNFFGGTILFAVTIITSRLFYVAVESPLIRYLNQLISKRKNLKKDPKEYQSLDEDTSVALEGNGLQTNSEILS